MTASANGHASSASLNARARSRTNGFRLCCKRKDRGSKGVDAVLGMLPRDALGNSLSIGRYQLQGNLESKSQHLGWAQRALNALLPAALSPPDLIHDRLLVHQDRQAAQPPAHSPLRLLIGATGVLSACLVRGHTRPRTACCRCYSACSQALAMRRTHPSLLPEASKIRKKKVQQWQLAP